MPSKLEKKVAKVKVKSPKKTTSQKDKLATVADNVEDRLAKSDLARKEGVRDDLSLPSFEPVTTPPKKTTQTSDPEMPKVPEPPKMAPPKAPHVDQRAELDGMHRRQTEYLDSLKRRLDQEMRERRSHIEAKKHTLDVKEKELEKWETALLKKEKITVAKDGDVGQLKKLHKQLEDKEISLKYEHMRVTEMKKELEEKERELKDLHHNLAVRDRQIAEREDKIHVLEAMLMQPMHNEESHEYFTEHEQKLKKIYEKKIKRLHLKEPDMEQPTPVKNLRISQEDAAIEQVQSMIIAAYQELGRENITVARTKYIAIKERYEQYVQEFSTNHQLHQEILQLYDDIVRFSSL